MIIPIDCAKQVKHTLLAEIGHIFCWRCGERLIEVDAVEEFTAANKELA